MAQPKRVLITGGTGFLRKHLALAMKNAHAVVVALTLATQLSNSR